ncbi:hypothetical protein LMG26685_04979 [Achromobacter mucicolens]|nr:hypothetical protein LMG26685_04979 [Achromobacter mucicolens]
MPGRPSAPRMPGWPLPSARPSILAWRSAMRASRSLTILVTWARCVSFRLSHTASHWSRTCLACGSNASRRFSDWSMRARGSSLPLSSCALSNSWRLPPAARMASCRLRWLSWAVLKRASCLASSFSSATCALETGPSPGMNRPSRMPLWKPPPRWPSCMAAGPPSAGGGGAAMAEPAAKPLDAATIARTARLERIANRDM